MSWGERSCTKEYECEPTFGTCNVDCEWYRWDGYTKPDSQFKTEKNKLKKKYKMMTPLERKIFADKLRALGILDSKLLRKIVVKGEK